MAKNNITQYDATAANNTDIDSINIDEGMAASDVNNALRSLMSHLKNVDTGSQALTALSVTGATTSGSLKVSDGGTIGSASDTDAMAISSGGVVTFSQTPVGAFISMADQWRLTSNTNAGSDADVTSNWERVDTSGWGGIGTGLTESSGIFSFASTGIHLIIFQAEFFMAAADASAGLLFKITLDNSNYNTAAQTNSAGRASGDGSTNHGGTGFFLFDVTNTTTHKFKFSTTSFGSSTRLQGNTDTSKTGFTVIRLGAT